MKTLLSLLAPQPGVARTTADSLRGRQLRSAKGTANLVHQGLSPEQKNWNARVEREKQERKARGRSK